jgi:hypothetical protein
MEAEIIALMCLFGVIITVSSILTKLTTSRLCCKLRITPFPEEHSRNIPPAGNDDVFENV